MARNTRLQWTTTGWLRDAIAALACTMVMASAAHAAPSMGLTRPAPPGAQSKACIAAGVKLAREQQALDQANADLARFTRERAACTTKSSCARNDDRIAGLHKRIPRNTARLKEFQSMQAQRCAPAG